MIIIGRAVTRVPHTTAPLPATPPVTSRLELWRTDGPSRTAGEVESDGDGVYTVAVPLVRVDLSPCASEDCTTTFKNALLSTATSVLGYI